MHRHGYKGRKLHRDEAQRGALLKDLSEALIAHGQITTTLPKAKELVPYIESLITKAKKGDLANRRHVIAHLHTVASATLLVDVVAPQITRSSGYTRTTRAELRRGDNAQLAVVEFVDTINYDIKPKPSPASPTKPVAKRPAKPAGATS